MKEQRAAYQEGHFGFYGRYSGYLRVGTHPKTATLDYCPFVLIISATNSSGSMPSPFASRNTVVMLGWRLFRSSRDKVVGCSPASSASLS